MRAPSRKPAPAPSAPSGPYNWFPIIGQNGYATDQAHWGVVVGARTAVSDANSTIVIEVLDKENNVLDRVMIQGDTAAGFAMEYLPRRMLVPPGGSVQTPGGPNNFSIVTCSRLEDALAIL